MITDKSIDAISTHVLETFAEIRRLEKGSLPAIVSASQVHDELTAHLFAIHEIGVTLEALGGLTLPHQVIDRAEQRLGDVQIAVFLNRRWDGHPRSGPRLGAGSEDCSHDDYWES